MKKRKWKAGTPISADGVYSGVPLVAYHSHLLCDGPSASSSMLRTLFSKSPAHMFCTWSGNPEAEPVEDKQAWILGRAAHHLLLGEDAFNTEFICRPPQWDSWRTNDAKAWRDREKLAGRTVLVPDDLKKIRGMARRLSEHPLIGEGILNGEVEQSMIWRDERTGLWLKSRPDVIPTASGDFADLKTSSTIGFDLDRSVFEWRYDMQAALAKWGAKATLGMDMETFSFVFIESDRPHTVDILTLHAREIEAAEADLRVAIDTMALCLETSDWFGPAGRDGSPRYVYPNEFHRTRSKTRREFLTREIERTDMEAA